MPLSHGTNTISSPRLNCDKGWNITAGDPFTPSLHFAPCYIFYADPLIWILCLFLPSFQKRQHSVSISWLIKVSLPFSSRHLLKFFSSLQENGALICPWCFKHCSGIAAIGSPVPLLFIFCWTVFFTLKLKFSLRLYLRLQTTEYNSHGGCVSEMCDVKERGDKWFRWVHSTGSSSIMFSKTVCCFSLLPEICKWGDLRVQMDVVLLDESAINLQFVFLVDPEFSWRHLWHASETPHDLERVREER